VNDAQAELALNEYLAGQEKIEVFPDRPGKRVFDRNDGSRDRPPLEAVKDVGRAGAGNNGFAWRHTTGSFVAEGTQFSLNSDFHEGKLAGARGESKWGNQFSAASRLVSDPTLIAAWQVPVRPLHSNSSAGRFSQ